MIKNQHYPDQRLPLVGQDFRSKNFISEETIISRNIHSYFQLAKMIVTKVGEIETKKEKVILVADDEPLTFQLIEDFFQDANLPCNILQASNGQMAYNMAVSKMPDLIITDWLMPQLDGLELIKQLKANSGTKDIPIILTTGAMIPNEEFNKILAAGAIDCLRKPLNDMELIARVKTALALREALDDIKDSEKSIHEKNQLLHFLIDVAPNPIFFMNKIGCVLGCNECFEKLVGKNKVEIAGNSIYQLLPKWSGNFTNEMLTADSEAINRYEVEFMDRSSVNRNLLLTCIGFGNESDEIIIGSLTDVTEIIQSGKSALQDLEINMERLQTELDSKHQKLASQAELLIHSKNVKSNFMDAVSKLHPYLTKEGKAKFFSLLKQIHWELNGETELHVEKDFDQLHAGLYYSLERTCPTITKNEKRLCAYLRMNHSSSDVARITNKSLNSINVAFARLRAKLQLPSSKDLRSFLLEIPCQTETVTA